MRLRLTFLTSMLLPFYYSPFTLHFSLSTLHSPLPTMDHKFTEQIKQWLETSEAERDYTVGALYLLKLSGIRLCIET